MRGAAGGSRAVAGGEAEMLPGGFGQKRFNLNFESKTLLKT